MPVRLSACPPVRLSACPPVTLAPPPALALPLAFASFAPVRAHSSQDKDGLSTHRAHPEIEPRTSLGLPRATPPSPLQTIATTHDMHVDPTLTHRVQVFALLPILACPLSILELLHSSNS
ncbi:hypothetical protein COCC4DRAFT_56633 [Bipolaris maydis ATCC 48331]|uniref:Uncharacterized protein n=2 Tax=Cochliobolus heterostrophus TaxID=5016 RepID=M2SZ64_COCH5|nr:uncharacterized protein COCC4DRAFT_56633 [Bipolaris maydis ATCC 48331]EMD90675.1 hypothetical protein COCHEDRAFT_1205125 [Bipolaris maydis C5]ENI09113.1 hypothetical protein COCC4DRAFT_56633 [Bipolaris maydis ATCC 48331]